MDPLTLVNTRRTLRRSRLTLARYATVLAGTRSSWTGRPGCGDS
jgi:hypothetical protein